MPLIRHGEDSRALAGRISEVWARRNDRYSEVRGTRAGERQKVEMYRLGG
jgi:cyclic pyranopterin phosphate synthase